MRESDVGPVSAAFWRLLLAVPLLVLLARVTRQPLGRPSGRVIWWLALSGLFFAADLAAWHIGILDTKLANATLFGNSTSLLFPIYGFLIARAWPTRTQGLALAMAAAGAALLMGRSAELSTANLIGDLMCVLAGVLYTFYLIAIDRVRSRLGAWPLLALSTLAGVVPLLALSLAMGERVWPSDWTPLILLALLSQVIGQGLMVYVIGRLSPLVIGLGLLTQPIVAATIGWTVYGETLGVLDWVGAAAIAAALVLVREPVRPRDQLPAG